MNATPPPREPTVLDSEGRVLYEPEPEKTGSERKPGGYTVAWGTTASGFRTLGTVPKLLLGAGFIALFTVGIAIAGVVLLAVLLGWILRFLLSPGRR